MNQILTGGQAVLTIDGKRLEPIPSDQISIEFKLPPVPAEVVFDLEKAVHKFTGPSIEVILCGDPTWTGYAADNWDKVTCPSCLLGRKRDE